MKFILDECVPASALVALTGAGFDASSVLKYLLPQSPDMLVAATADAMGAIIVSHDRDFKRIISRQPDGQVRQFRNVHLIKMDCKQRRIADRMLMAMPIIRAEHNERQTMRDRRMIIWVRTDYVRVWR